ncbi:hypothetical protein GOBAR_DD31606 [Gossypium barbadense]|nr:hypothetical protein GOBAR_DD31606 [Gossypium barbadense]
MDSMGTLLEGDWSCFSGMYTTEQEADFMAQLLSNCPQLPDIDMSNYLKMGKDGNVEKEPKPEPEKKSSNKRSRNSGDVHVQKTKRNGRSKKNQTIAANDDEDGNGGLNGQSWASCSSEDDSNGGANSGSKGEATLNLNGKTRASRGAATDPQSLYARKRRERINERLRILQNLVPNGTKVDISTMLEEAVQYVKFLQLQIKLLSSDDLWMYAPIAYNGMDIGIDLKVGTAKRT